MELSIHLFAKHEVSQLNGTKHIHNKKKHKDVCQIGNIGHGDLLSAKLLTM